MHKIIFMNSRQLNSWRLFIFISLVAVSLLNPFAAHAHQTPNTIVILDASPKKITLELQMPLSELELGFGHNITRSPETLIRDFGPQLKEYLAAHIKAYLQRSQPWSIEIKSLRMDKGKYIENNLDYWELVANVVILPTLGESTRKFTLDYDVIMHQVMNHAALVSVRGDWEAGRIDTNITSEAMVISRNMSDNLIHPLQIDLKDGSWFNGFKTMVALGAQHIKEGTDHLLFLLTLLLPAALIAAAGRWSQAGSVRYSLLRILKIVTAFTIGHSITLLIGAVGILHFPSRPIEILIAVSILVSAVHAIKPIFPGKEMFVAGGFGLIHGMAFAQTLTNLNLDGGSMALSILGFNIGIELMQLFVIAITMPWLIMLSRSLFYPYVRIMGAVLAGIAAIAWIFERVSDHSNPMTRLVSSVAPQAYLVIILLAILSISTFFIEKRQRPTS